jgi:TonB family protein
MGVFDIDILEEPVMRLLDPRPLSSTRLAKVTLFAGTVILAACWLAAPKLSVTAAPGKGQATTAATKTGTITGIVVDTSGARLQGAWVWLIGRPGPSAFVKTTVTDAAGNFGFKDVTAGRYSLEADFPGKAPSYRTISVKPGGPAPFFQFVLESGAAAGGATHPTMLGKAPKRIRINGEVEAAKAISQPPPKYPQSAKARGVQGLVRIDAIISAAGAPEQLSVMSSPDKELSKAAVDAVRQWRYRPTLLNGKPVAIETEVDVDFSLQP